MHRVAHVVFKAVGRNSEALRRNNAGKMTQEQLEKYIDLKRERDHLEKRIDEATDRRERRAVQKLYEKKKRLLTKQLIEIERAIETLEPRERLLVRLHYIEGFTFEEIEQLMHYERSQIYRIRKIALEALKKL
jgi:RNA polymerase sigma factor (sigma-70 family)